MRIVLASSSFSDKGGGIAAYNRVLCQLLGAQGHKILVISTEVDLPETWEFPNGVSVRTVGLSIPTVLKDHKVLAEKIFNIVVKYDPHVIISSNHALLTSIYPCFADHRIRITVSHYYDGVLARSAALRAKNTDWIVAISNAGRDWLLQYTEAFETQVPVIYNTVNDLQIDNEKHISAKASESELRIVYPGGGAEHKSPDTVLNVIKHLQTSEVKWRLFWLGREGFIRYLMPRRSENVILTGLVSKESAEEYIMNSHCLLLPSRGEGCPMAVLEAMRSGTIPIVSDCHSAMREIVEHGVSGFISPVGQHKDFTKNIISIAESQDIRRSLMIGARSAFDRDLSPPRWVNNMERIMNTRRNDRTSTKATDQFSPAVVVPWHHRVVTWKNNPILRAADRIKYARHVSRCTLAALKLRGNF